YSARSASAGCVFFTVTGSMRGPSKSRPQAALAADHLSGCRAGAHALAGVAVQLAERGSDHLGPPAADPAGAPDRQYPVAGTGRRGRGDTAGCESGLADQPV